MQRENIYAVIWQDFGTPLSLKVADAATAIQKARDMASKAHSANITLYDLRAVHLDNADTLHTLWKPTS